MAGTQTLTSSKLGGVFLKAVFPPCAQTIFPYFTMLCKTKGVKPPEAFGERSRDWSLGHAGDEGPHLSMTGESRGCSRAAAPVCGFPRGTTARSVSLSWGAGEVGSPCEWRGFIRLYVSVISDISLTSSMGSSMTNFPSADLWREYRILYSSFSSWT